MENYRRKFIPLLNCRDSAAIWLGILNTPLEEVVAELSQQGCSTRGSDQVLRERLFRLRTKILFGEVVYVPWSKTYDRASATED